MRQSLSLGNNGGNMEVIVDLIIYFIISLFTKEYDEPIDDTLGWLIFDETDREWHNRGDSW